MVLDASFTNDYPRGYRVELSPDGKAWAKATEGWGSATPTEIIFSGPKKGRFIRITQTVSDPNVWSIAELVLLKPR